MGPLLWLASRSPRRRELLWQIGVPHECLAVELDETPRAAEPPADYVLRLAREKAETAQSRLAGRQALPVLAADTAVVVEGRILGKPAGREQALEMLALLSGRSHQVYSGVALAGHETATRLSVSRVEMRVITRAEALAYWASGEPAGKAGGYAIQGRGAIFIRELHGSYSGVMGLPLYETANLLGAAGIRLPRPAQENQNQIDP